MEVSGEHWIVTNALTAKSFCDFIQKHIQDGFSYKVFRKQTNSWPMLKLWRVWMQETSEFMSGNGVTMPLYIDSQGKHHGKRPFNADDAHELFTTKWLGQDEFGNRYSWKLYANETGKTAADTGQRVRAMEQHFAWATERGLNLTNPENSEFRKLC